MSRISFTIKELADVLQVNKNAATSLICILVETGQAEECGLDYNSGRGRPSKKYLVNSELALNLPTSDNFATTDSFKELGFKHSSSISGFTKYLLDSNKIQFHKTVANKNVYIVPNPIKINLFDPFDAQHFTGELASELR